MVIVVMSCTPSVPHVGEDECHPILLYAAGSPFAGRNSTVSRLFANFLALISVAYREAVLAHIRLRVSDLHYAPMALNEIVLRISNLKYAFSWRVPFHCGGNVAISHEQLIYYLKLQFNFIDNSCQLFDNGQQYEAIRIAVALRTLFHTHYNEKQKRFTSISLLKLLGQEKVEMLSSCLTVPDVPNENLLAWHGGLSIRQETQYADGSVTITGHPPLDDMYESKYIPADEWWVEPYSITEDYVRITRSATVRNAANKDGGTHIDELPDEYQALIDRMWVPNQQLADLRQMGYEVLHSPALVDLMRPVGGS